MAAHAKNHRPPAHLWFRMFRAKKKDLTHAQLAPGKVGDFAPAKGVAGVESHGSVREASPKMCAGMKGALPTIRSNRLKTWKDEKIQEALWFSSRFQHQIVLNSGQVNVLNWPRFVLISSKSLDLWQVHLGWHPTGPTDGFLQLPVGFSVLLKFGTATRSVNVAASRRGWFTMGREFLRFFSQFAKQPIEFKDFRVFKVICYFLLLRENLCWSPEGITENYGRDMKGPIMLATSGCQHFVQKAERHFVLCSGGHLC